MCFNSVIDNIKMLTGISLRIYTVVNQLFRHLDGYINPNVEIKLRNILIQSPRQNKEYKLKSQLVKCYFNFSKVNYESIYERNFLLTVVFTA